MKITLHSILTLFTFVTLALSQNGFAQEPMLLEHGGGVRAVEFSPIDASLLATAGESNIIKLWNLKNNTVQILRGHTGIVNSIAFSPNSELLASVSNDKTIKLWNVGNQQNVRTLQDGTPYRSLAFSPDGQMLATAGGHHVKLWNLPNLVEIERLDNNRGSGRLPFQMMVNCLPLGRVWERDRRM